MDGLWRLDERVGGGNKGFVSGVLRSLRATLDEKAKIWLLLTIVASKSQLDNDRTYQREP